MLKKKNSLDVTDILLYVLLVGTVTVYVINFLFIYYIYLNTSYTL